MDTLNIAVVVGSNRRESVNRKLAQALIPLAPAGLSLTLVPIDDLPIYNADLEGQRPAGVQRFVDTLAAAHAVLVVTPEHNRSIPAVLKSAIDWASKPMDRNAWRDKPVAITGGSPGTIATAVAQQHLRQVLAVLGATVMGGEAYVSFKPDYFDAEGGVADAGNRAFLQAFLARFATLTERLTRPLPPG